VGVDAEHRAVVTARALRDAAAELALVASPPVLLLVIRYFSWGAGPLRLVMCALLFAGSWLATARRGYVASFWERRRWWLVLAAISCGMLLWHARSFAADIRRGGECLTDMGRPSICAGEWLRRRLNPWAECAPQLTAAERRALDPRSAWAECMRGDRCIDLKAGNTYRGWTHHGPGFDFMDGYKYGPLTALAYLPFAHVLQERGLFSVNFACWIAQALLLWLLARAAFPEQRAAPARTLLTYLLPLALPMSLVLPRLEVHAFWGTFSLSPPERDTFVLELTRRCSNDIIPVVLVLAAILIAARGRSRAAGVVLGLSLAAKPLPGLLLFVLLPGLEGVSARKLMSACVLTTALWYLPLLVWAPRELIANLVLFSILRPTNSSSIREYLSPAMGDLVGVLQLALVAVLAWRFYRDRAQRDLPGLVRVSALAAIGFVALNKIVHGNYLLWIQPLLALTIAGLPFRAAPEAIAAQSR
jgi:hypothetical protein